MKAEEPCSPDPSWQIISQTITAAVTATANVITALIHAADLTVVCASDGAVASVRTGTLSKRGRGKNSKPRR